jgi:hypothetical protein
MRAQLLVVAGTTFFLAQAAAGDGDYVQSRCELRESKELDLRLSTARKASRNLTFSPPSLGGVMFRGTTIDDMKWMADYPKFKEFVFVRPETASISGMLVLVDVKSNSKHLGWITSECWKLVRQVVDGAVPTRVQAGT